MDNNPFVDVPREALCVIANIALDSREIDRLIESIGETSIDFYIDLRDKLCANYNLESDSILFVHDAYSQGYKDALNRYSNIVKRAIIEGFNAKLGEPDE